MLDIISALIISGSVYHWNFFLTFLKMSSTIKSMLDIISAWIISGCVYHSIIVVYCDVTDFVIVTYSSLFIIFCLSCIFTG